MTSCATLLSNSHTIQSNLFEKLTIKAIIIAMARELGSTPTGLGPRNKRSLCNKVAKYQYASFNYFRPTLKQQLVS